MRFRRVAGVSLLSNPHGIHPQSRLVFLVGMNWNRDRHNYFSRGHVDVVHVICTFSPAPFHMSRKMWLQGAVVFVPQLLLVWASQQDGAELHFSASGQFKIAQFADCKKCMHQLMYVPLPNGRLLPQCILVKLRTHFGAPNKTRYVAHQPASYFNIHL